MEPKDSKPKIILNMIVKNEVKIIERCLDSCLPIISGAVILDTGSTDETLEAIRQWGYTNKVPIETYSHKFDNFSHCRNLAMSAIWSSLRGHRFDYILFLDAGMELYDINYDLWPKEQSHLKMKQKYGSLTYFNSRMIKANHEARWKGVVHEYLESALPEKSDFFKVRCHQDGGNQEGQAERYRDLLLEGLKYEPQNSRYRFYLANTYFDMGDYIKAYYNYKLRIRQGGWEEEVWYCYYRCGVIRALQKHRFTEDSLIAAWRLRPSRVEPLVVLRKYLAEKGEIDKANQYEWITKDWPQTGDQLFVESGLYRNNNIYP